jgi:hypothetical protein
MGTRLFDIAQASDAYAGHTWRPPAADTGNGSGSTGTGRKRIIANGARLMGGTGERDNPRIGLRRLSREIAARLLNESYRLFVGVKLNCSRCALCLESPIKPGHARDRRASVNPPPPPAPLNSATREPPRLSFVDFRNWIDKTCQGARRYQIGIGVEGTAADRRISQFRFCMPHGR